MRPSRCRGRPAAEAGALILHAGSVQPALLVQGLRRLVAAAGVRIYEATPMVGLQRTLPAVVKTPSGSVTADKVVLASGTRLALIPELRRTVFILPSHVVATASSAEALDDLGWVAGRPSRTDARPFTTRSARLDDRVVFGRGGGRLGFGGHIIPAHYHDAREIEEIVADMHAMLPATRGLAVEWRWGGRPGAHPARHSLGRRPGQAPQRPLRPGLLRQRRLGLQPDRSHPGIGRPGCRRRLRAVAAGLRAADLPATGARPLGRRTRRAQRHRTLRGAGGSGSQA